MRSWHRRRIPVAALAASVSLSVGASVGRYGVSPQIEQAFAEEAAHVFHGAGVVTAIDAAQGTITIDHGEIPGLMDAMQMMYRVRPEMVPLGLQKGDRIEFGVDGATYELREIKKTPPP